MEVVCWVLVGAAVLGWGWDGEMRTADGGFFVLLELIVDESEDERGLRGRESVVV